MSRLATTAIGGLAALTALLVLRGVRRPPADAQPELIVIHSEPRYDTPQLQRGAPAPRMLFVPLN